MGTKMSKLGCWNCQCSQFYSSIEGILNLLIFKGLKPLKNDKILPITYIIYIHKLFNKDLKVTCSSLPQLQLIDKNIIKIFLQMNNCNKITAHKLTAELPKDALYQPLK